MPRLALPAQHLPALAAALPLAGWAVHSGVLTARLRAARRDPLTGLATRQGFEQAAPRLLRRPDTGVLFLDLDHFKAINDTYGHAAGDRALTATAATLRTFFATGGGIAARLGGDEFAAIGPLLPFRAELRLNSLLFNLPSLTMPDGSEVRISASVGVARVGDLPDTSLPAVLGAADAAMYDAKRSGGGRWTLATAVHQTQDAPNRWRRTRPATSERSGS